MMRRRVGGVSVDVHAVHQQPAPHSDTTGHGPRAVGAEVLRVVIVGQPGQTAVVAARAAGDDRRPAAAPRAATGLPRQAADFVNGPSGGRRAIGNIVWTFDQGQRCQRHTAGINVPPFFSRRVKTPFHS